MPCTTLLVAALSFILSPAEAPLQDLLQQVQANLDSSNVDGDESNSRAEFRNLKVARWSQIDCNGDGSFGEDDFPAAVHRARTQLADIAELNADGGDQISREDVSDWPALLFDQADRNSDGVLSRSEVGGTAS